MHARWVCQLPGAWAEEEMMIHPLPVTEANYKAVSYVGTNPTEGLAQLEILKRLGCGPDHKVLEIGCGALIAGYPIIQYLNVGGYVGVDPNLWLVHDSLRVPEVSDVATRGQATFVGTEHFGDRSGPVDFCISHSVLSHAADAQLDEFLRAIFAALAPDGVAAASLRFADGNEFGSTGSAKHGPDFQTWQYPGVSWFKRVDVLERARRAGLEATIEPEFTRLVLKANQSSVHDWITLRRV